MDLQTFLTVMREKQLRAFEFYGRPLPAFSVWDPRVPDSRLADPKKRGEFYSRQYGSMSRAYCAKCGRPSNYAVSDSMLKLYYVCLPCTLASGPPANAAVVPGTELM